MVFQRSIGATLLRGLSEAEGLKNLLSAREVELAADEPALQIARRFLAGLWQRLERSW